MRNIYILLIFTHCIVSCKTNQEEGKIKYWKAKAENITVIRDDFGIPHIYGKTDADAVFGMVYAQCEDDFNRVEMNYITAIGRLAEIEGEEYLYNDLRARLYMTTDKAKANYEASPDWLKKLCDAFADGANYYLHTHPEVKPKLITQFEPWMPMYFSEGSIGGDIERISTERLKAFYEEDSSLALTAFGDGLVYPDPYEEPEGSNGFAIAPELTQSGNAMLLINPHTSFFFRGEMHMVSEEGLNAYGAVTWGQFFIYQGFNEKTGWMHTSTRTDCIDEFLETVTEKEGKLFYQYGEELRPVEVSEVNLSYKEGDSLKTQTFPMYHTHHGPIVRKQGEHWVATSIMWKPIEALTQSYTRTKTTGYDSFNQMMAINTNSSNNTVYADAEGNIGYYHGNFVPKRDTTFDYNQPVDGSNPATDWQAPHPLSEQLTILNPKNGWIQNCNSTPFTAAAEFSPKQEDYPPYLAPDEENFRGIQAVRVLSGQKDFTLDKLIAVAYDPYLTAFEVLIPGLIKAYDQAGQKMPELGDPIDTLRSWDNRVSGNSVAMSLAVYYGQTYLEKGTAPDELNFIERLTYYGKESADEEKLEIFAAAVQQVEEDFGQWQTEWAEINRYQRLNGDIRQPFDDDKPSTGIPMASSRWGALASFGARTYPGTKRMYGTSGNSFVAVVEFGEKVKAKSLLAGGQSGDPESPHFDDQVEMYVEGKFKDVAYYREDVEARAEHTYHPGE
ncbi:acylase [Catalinimonas niigatensis]|uniref:acylase n=1 Tax=Catalinimonas niigatensis TaxID=1397264 RepID=UPI002666F04C|nr:acylase [Catalinimonas niigatensis]WPP51172.1 acylase [Catalinimonas niigatensis]